MINQNTVAARWLGGAVLAGAALLAGCASTDSSMSSLMGSGTGVTASDSTRLTQSGFLSDYARLKPTAWGDGMQCWRDPKLDAKQYDKVLISRMVVTLKPGQEQGIDPTDLKTLTDYFHASLTKALKPHLRVVDKPGRGVAVLRVALTNLVPTGVGRSVTGTLIPYAFVVEAGSGVRHWAPRRLHPLSR